jgi:hypothetical protein
MLSPCSCGPAGMSSRLAPAPVSAPIRHGGARDSAVTVCQWHSEIGCAWPRPRTRSPISSSTRRPAWQRPGGHRAGSACNGWVGRARRGRRRVQPEAVRGTRAATGRPGRVAGLAPEGPSPGRKSPFLKYRVRGTSGPNSPRPHIGSDHPDLYTFGAVGRVFCSISPKTEWPLLEVIVCFQFTSARGHPRVTSRGGAACGTVESPSQVAASGTKPNWPASRKPRSRDDVAGRVRSAVARRVPGSTNAGCISRAARAPHA